MLLALLLACTEEAQDSGEAPLEGLAFPVTAEGPLAVGYRSWEVTYTPGAGIEPRTIQVGLWYPAAEANAAEARDTMGFLLDRTSLGAALAEPAYAGGHPVVVHSHGYQGWGGNSAFLGHWLASHGFLFVAPDHTDNTLFGAVDPLPLAHWAERPMDITAALDSLALEVPEAALDRVLLSGHSFGVYTTWGAGGAAYDTETLAARCEAGDFNNGVCTAEELDLFEGDLSDPRVVATIPMAGSYSTDWFGELGYRTIQGPVLAMSGSEDDVGADDQWARMTDISIAWLDIAGGCHQTFGIGGCTGLADEEGWRIVSTYALAFARQRLFADPTVAAILDGSEGVAEGARYQRR